MDGWVKRIKTQSKGGEMSGRTLQSLDRSARTAATGGGDRQQVAEAFREALHNNFGKTAKDGVKQVWDEARQQWATLKTLEPVVARNTEGGVPLQQLEGAINATQRGRTLRSRGRDGEMGTLATVGQRLQPPRSSMTPEGAIASQWYNPLAWPVITAASLGGLVARGTVNNSRLAQLFMREGRGQTRQLVAPYAAAAPVATPQMKKAKDARKRP